MRELLGQAALLLRTKITDLSPRAILPPPWQNSTSPAVSPPLKTSSTSLSSTATTSPSVSPTSPTPPATLPPRPLTSSPRLASPPRDTSPHPTAQASTTPTTPTPCPMNPPRPTPTSDIGVLGRYRPPSRPNPAMASIHTRTTLSLGPCLTRVSRHVTRRDRQRRAVRVTTPRLTSARGATTRERPRRCVLMHTAIRTTIPPRRL